MRTWLQPIMSLKESVEVGYEILSRVEFVDDVQSYFAAMKDADVAALVAKQISQINAVGCSGRIPLRKRFFINIRPNLLNDDGFISRICTESLFPLALEVDYQDLKTQSEQYFNYDFLEVLRKHGHQIWLDDYTCDFNSHSCFDVLSNPWDGIKIDKTVLWHSCYDYDELREIVERCRELCEVVLIEGVESEQHVSACRNAKVDLGQGFYWQDRLVF